MALCSRAVQGVRAALPACASRQYSSAVAVSLDEALSGVTSGLPLPGGLDAKPTAQVSTLKNGLKIASFETYAPVATIGLVVGAGSAHEASHEIGASAMFRALAFKSNASSTQFAVARSTEEIGGRLHSVSSRDHLVLYASATRDHAGHLVDVLANEFAEKKVLPWELQQARDEVAYQAYATVNDPAFQVIDGLHGAAFRGPLGNSVNPNSHRLNSVTVDTLAQWAAAKYVTGNAVLVGYGIQHEELVRLAEENFAGAKSGGAAARAKSTYGGASEHRVDNGSYISHVALGFEGAASSSADALAIGVLQHALGVSSAVKWGASNSILSKKLASVIKAPATLTAFSASYADTGLFGVHAVSASNDIGCVVGAARDALKEVASKGLSGEDVARGKAQLKLSILSGAESAYAGIERMGAEALASGKVSNAVDIAKAIDGISDAAVNQIAKKVLSSKPTLAAVGDLTQIPHLDQLA